MYDTWISSHFINTAFFPVLVLGVTIIISANSYLCSFHGWLTGA
ncbi:hypothetical protein [Bacillus sp. B4EP4a]|nr:hypothetical protein [Bacillus sp. B4EP4a]